MKWFRNKAQTTSPESATAVVAPHVSHVEDNRTKDTNTDMKRVVRDLDALVARLEKAVRIAEDGVKPPAKKGTNRGRQ